MRVEECEDRKDAARRLLHELRSQQNVRFLRALPAFRVDDDMPDVFEDLLGRLEEAEDACGSKGPAGRDGSDWPARRTRGALHAPPDR